MKLGTPRMIEKGRLFNAYLSSEIHEEETDLRFPRGYHQDITRYFIYLGVHYVILSEKPNVIVSKLKFNV